MNYASFLGRGFSIVTTLGRTRGRAADLVDRYGMQLGAGGVSTPARFRFWNSIVIPTRER